MIRLFSQDVDFYPGRIVYPHFPKVLRERWKKADMRIEFFFPAKESTILPKSGLKFQSYYVVENMISVIVEDHFEENMEKAYAALIEYAEAKKLKIISSFYNEFFKTVNGGYYIVKAVINENE